MWQNLLIHSISAGNFFCQTRKLFSAEIWKMTKYHFWANVMLSQCRVQASRTSPAQKSRGLRLVYSKNFSRRIFFVFWRTHLVNMFMSSLPVKQIWRKSAVCNSASLSISFHFSDILTVQYLLILNLTVCDISCVLSLIRKICKGPSINNVGKHFRYIFDTPLPHVGTSFL